MYPDEIVIPCRSELTNIGVESLESANAVDDVLGKNEGSVLVVVNSVCGCAAGQCRPAVRMALENGAVPDRKTTVFAGVDSEATQRAREYMIGYAPSSPAIALFKDGKQVMMIERHMIEGRPPEMLAAAMKDSFDTHCS
ncbi:MAG: BrxA/BrxB family bacilliredoxin [bacterium]|nr:BrxA/BrxB family bacilliredoxin [bacterium]